MDAITRWALSIDNPVIRSVGMLLHNNLIFAVLIVLIVFVAESRNSKRLKIFIALVMVLLLILTIKTGTAHMRPCASEPWCPLDYSFPSLHAAIAFTLMIAFLNKRSYPLFMLFALFVCFTRLNIGVHVFEDIAGALPFALISYYITDIIFDRGLEWIRSMRGSFSTSG